MASIWDSMISGPALSGAISGATSGMMVGGPWGALAGGVAGGVGGSYVDYKRDAANSQAKKSQSQVLQNIEAMNRSGYKQHIADLNKALSFYAVPQNYWDSLYGSGTGTAPTLGQGTWSNTGVK